MHVVQDAVRALKARLSDATAALQISHSEALRLRTRVADLKAAVSWVRLISFMQEYTQSKLPNDFLPLPHALLSWPCSALESCV
jgi:hypothetical protein